MQTREQIEGEINALKQLLSDTDYMCLKHSEGVLTDEEYEPTKLLRIGYRSRINELKSVLKRMS